MKVPKLFAERGGDIGPGDLGLKGVDGKDCPGYPSVEKRWGLSGDIVRGSLGIPWVESGRNFLLAPNEAGTI